MVSGIKPFFPFYGGKWRAAPHYPKPQHDVIVEPFAGSAGYSLRYPSHDVTIVERDPLIAATWRYLLRVTSDEIMGLPLLNHGQRVDEFDLSPDQALLLGWWVNPGSSAPKKTMGAFRGAWNATYRERIAGQIHAIRHWKLIDGGYEQSPNVNATWFIDPPYASAGRHYRIPFSDFDELAVWCKSRRGQVIVCENEGAAWLPFRPFITIKSNNSQSDGRVSREAIWTNAAT